jgi:hypothetical protein
VQKKTKKGFVKLVYCNMESIIIDILIADCWQNKDEKNTDFDYKLSTQP